MQLLQQDRPPNVATVIRIATVLGVLLIVLAVIALLNDVLGVLDRFRSAIYLFVFGAILAYLMEPPVRLLKRMLRINWVAVMGAYLLLFAGLAVFALLLINPFISQARSLIENLRNPATGSLVSLQIIQQDVGRVQSDLSAQQHLLSSKQPILQQQVAQTQADISLLAQQVSNVLAGKIPHGSTQIPPTYVAPMVPLVNQLRSSYEKAIGKTGTIDPGLLALSVTAGNQANAKANALYQQTSSTPILLLDLQTLLDNRGIQVDLRDKFGKALQQLSNELASILNNALSITLQAGNLLLNTVLTLLISIYFLNDGGRFIRWLIQLVPARTRPQVASAVTNLDQILGSYLRTQILIALIAATLDASGALILGIPYAIVIFFSSFLLSLVPVIGPVILPFPPLLIAVVFSPLPKPIIYLAWLLVGEQFATNVLGPRLQAHNLRIHPLEAMAAALIGLPLAGLLGAFFAVPIVAFIHIVVHGFAQAHGLAEPGPKTTSSGGARDP